MTDQLSNEKQEGSEPVVLDVRGLNCPLPVLKARKALSTMASGAHLLVETTDPLAAIDIPAFCNEAGHRLVSTMPVAGGAEAGGADKGFVGYLIEKG